MDELHKNDNRRSKNVPKKQEAEVLITPVTRRAFIKAAGLGLAPLTLYIYSNALGKDIPKIAVWDLVPRNISSDYTQQLTAILVSEISKLGKYETYSQENIRTLAGWTAEKMQLGCSDTKCLTALGQMDIDKLISGSVGKIGTRYTVSLNLFDTQNARAEKAVSEFCRSEEELIELTQMALLKLLGETQILAPIVASPPAPRVAGSKLSILQGTYFIVPAQDIYKKQAAEWGKANGISAAVDFVNWPDLQPKILASIQAGGYDIVELWPGWNYLYSKNLVDLTDMAEAFGKSNGGFEKYVLNSGKVGGKWLGIPHGYSNASMAYRINWFKEAGCPNAEDGNKVDLTWEEYFAIAKKLKAKGKPFGQALGHSTGDPPGFCYPYMWSYGAMEVSKDGKSIQFNKPQFVDGMKTFIQAWKDGYDETGTSWDDSNNNRAYLSEQISSTFNGSSIYFAAKIYKPELAKDIHHILIPKGPAGRFYWLETRTFAILKNSKNIPAAKEFLKWWFDEKQFGDWWRLQEGYMLQPVVKYSNDPIWFRDPKMTPFREQPKYGLNQGYAGPPNQKAAMAWSKFIVVDTFAKAVQTGDAKASIEWGAEQLKRIYDL